MEFDWIACDLIGHIGFFSTAGRGYVPAVVLSIQHALAEAFDSVTRLPAIATALPVADTNGDVSDWIAVAKRGLFAFDWRREINCYELIARPSTPLSLKEIQNEDVRSTASLVLFDLRFDSVTKICDATAIRTESLRGGWA